MKIVYLVHQFFPEFQSGTENFVYNVALMTQKVGNKVKVITYSGYDDAAYDHEDNGILSKELIYRGIPVLAFKYKNPPIDLTYALANESMHGFARRVLEAEAPDILHVGHSMRVHPFIGAAAELKIPYLLTLTDFFLLCPKVILAPNAESLCGGPLGGAACEKLCREISSVFIKKRMQNAATILSHASKIITPSKFVRNIFLQEFPDLDIQTIGHGMRFKHIAPNRRKYGTDSRLVFGYAGTLAQHKGLHVLVNAFQGIQQANIELRIYGAGASEYVQRLKDQTVQDARVKFCGVYSAEQIGAVYADIDVMVIPSICYESYTYVLHEALASYVPVIGSDLGGIGEKIENGVNGYTFRPGDAGDLRAKMETLIDHPLVLNELKQNIRRGMYIPTIEGEGYQYFKLYTQLG